MENKCPHCGQPMPKSSSFCMHCMQSIYEKDYQLKQNKKSNKNAVIICVLAAVIAVSGILAFVIIRHKKASENLLPVSAVSTSATETSAQLTTTQKAPETTTKKAAKKKTKKEKKKATTAAQTTVVKEIIYETAPKPTKAPSTTASNKVVINGGVLSDYPNSKKDSSYTVPYSVTSISSGAFHGNTHLKSLKFSKRTNLSCNWSNLFANLPNLEKIYIYTGTSADTQGMQYFDGEIIYYYD